MSGTRKHLTESLYHRCVAETISSLKNVVQLSTMKQWLHQVHCRRSDMRLGYRAWVSQPMILMFHLSRLTEENKQNLSLLFPPRIVIIVMHSFPVPLSLVIETQNASINLFFTLLFAASQVVIVLSGYCEKKNKQKQNKRNWRSFFRQQTWQDAWASYVPFFQRACLFS